MNNCKLSFSKNHFEKNAWQNNLYVCGIDEVGRGCLAGPVIVSAAILPINTRRVFKDSKVLSELERECDYDWIIKNAFYSTVILSNDIVDKVNIYRATLIAMKRAFVQMTEMVTFDSNLIKYLVVDAMPLVVDFSYKHSNLEIHYFPYGESVSKSIAAASIVAKVTRDRLMCKMDHIIPGFNFSQHKGYGTREHVNLIKKNGISIIHRKSFLEGIIKNEPRGCGQQNIFDV